MYGKNKDYLSYSAVMLWINNKELYRRRYYDLLPDMDNVYMRFGKKIAGILEGRDYKEYPELKKVPFYPVSEHQVIVEIKGVTMKGYLDLYDPETFSIGEVKTGSVSRLNGPPWTKAKVMAHEQLPFYSLMVKETYGKVNPYIDLIWVETRFKEVTEKVGEHIVYARGHELELTGKVEVFKRRIAEWERLRVARLIKKTSDEIEKDYANYQKTNK